MTAAARTEADTLLADARYALDEITEALDADFGRLPYSELETLRRLGTRLASEVDDTYERVAKLAEQGRDRALDTAADRVYAVAVEVGRHASIVIGIVDREISNRRRHVDAK